LDNSEENGGVLIKEQFSTLDNNRLDEKGSMKSILEKWLFGEKALKVSQFELSIFAPTST